MLHKKIVGGGTLAACVVLFSKGFTCFLTLAHQERVEGEVLWNAAGKQRAGEAEGTISSSDTNEYERSMEVPAHDVRM